jgi:hypothetical protein
MVASETTMRISTPRGRSWVSATERPADLSATAFSPDRGEIILPPSGHVSVRRLESPA